MVKSRLLYLIFLILFKRLTKFLKLRKSTKATTQDLPHWTFYPTRHCEVRSNLYAVESKFCVFDLLE
ncbi:MAG: hypothetical protein JWR38_4535 [Mucilaginibacter sp.]|nr:hypothetical protein [Mucilaginibacter sp.]